MSSYEVAKRVGLCLNTVLQLRNGRAMPSLVVAFKIEKELGIPASSWLGTEIGRYQWALVYDWGAYMERQAKEKLKNDKRRRAKAREEREAKKAVAAALDAFVEPAP